MRIIPIFDNRNIFLFAPHHAYPPCGANNFLYPLSTRPNKFSYPNPRRFFEFPKHEATQCLKRSLGPKIGPAGR